MLFTFSRHKETSLELVSIIEGGVTDGSLLKHFATGTGYILVDRMPGEGWASFVINPPNLTHLTKANLTLTPDSCVVAGHLTNLSTGLV